MEYKKIVMPIGSKSDAEVAVGAKDVFDHFRIPYDALLISADRVPEKADEIADKLNKGKYAAALCIGGMSFIMPGVIKSKAPTKPVYAVPVAGVGAPLAGMDALYSIIQRPPGTPVACVGINQAGNAALQIVEWYAQLYPESGLDSMLREYKADQASKKGYDQAEFPWPEPKK